MKPQLLALITAMAWGIGGYFEKKGLHLGQLSPHVGITVRTAVALVVLSAVSAPQFGRARRAGTLAWRLRIGPLYLRCRTTRDRGEGKICSRRRRSMRP
jgi:hypothetical protein